MDPKKWKLYRACYNIYGLLAIEGVWPQENFHMAMASSTSVPRCVLGTKYKLNKHVDVKVEVEGSEENLKYILMLIQKSEGMPTQN